MKSLHRQNVSNVIDNALSLLPKKYVKDFVKLNLLTIAQYESRCIQRRQVSGPARGLWQFEQTGVLATIKHPSNREFIENQLEELNLFNTLVFEASTTIDYLVLARDIYIQLADDDLLAAVMARLLLYTDNECLSYTPNNMYKQYVRTWNPGKKSYARWLNSYETILTLDF